ncbi:MAG: PAS domain S-box protein, partial [Methanomicrobiales archaeon]|nr:PAS domain S-box protein [Methanomicrobiales archaeon]
MLTNQEIDDRLCAIFAHAHEAVAVVQDTFLVYFNVQFEHLTGFSREELLYSSASIIVHPDDWSGIHALYLRRVAGEETQESYNTRIIRKSGEVRRIHLNASVISWKNKPAILYFIADKTENLKKEHKLLETEEKYRTVVDNAIEGIFVIQEGRIKFVNPKITELTGYSSEEIYTRPFIEFVHPLDRERARTNCIRIFDHHNTALSDNLRILDANSMVRWIKVSGIAIEWEGRPAILNFVHDITPLKEIEMERKNIEEKFKKFIEIAQEGILVMDPVGTITYANPYMAEMLGYDPDGITGRSFLEFLSAADAKIIPSALTPRNLTTRALYEFRFIRKDGNRIHTNFVVSPIRNTDGHITGSVAVVSDITERKSAEMALQQSREDLARERDKLRGILDAMNDGVCIISQDHVVTYCNPVMIQKFGRVDGKECHRYLNGRDAECPSCKNGMVLQGTSVQGEWTSAVTGLVYDLFETPIHMPDGSTSKLAIFHDINDRKQTEKNLAQSESKLVNILQGLPVAALMIDAGHTIIHWNHALEVMTGTSSEEMKRSGDNWRLALYKTKRPVLADIILDGGPEQLKRWYGDKVHESRIIPGAYEVIDFFPHLGTDGKWLRGIARTIRDAEGNVIGAVETIEDLTEQIAMEQTIVEEKDRAKNLLDIAGAMILALDTNGVVTLINEKGCGILACRKEDILGKDWVKTFLPENVRNEVKSVFSKIIAGDFSSSGHFENPVLTHDRKERIISWNNSVIRDKQGRITGTLSSGEDITERKIAESALKESEARLQIAQRASGAGTWDWNVSTGTIVWSPQLFELFGLNPQQDHASFAAWNGILHPGDLNVANARIERALQDHTILDSEYRIILPDKQVRWINALGEGIYDAKGCAVRMTGICIDITERKRAEEALKESEQRLRRFFESGLIGVIYWNMNGRITDANDKFLDMVGYTRDDLEKGEIGWNTLTPPEYRDRDEASIAELKATGVNQIPFEKEYFRKDGTRIPVIIAGAMVDKERFSGVAFVLDNTQRKKAEEGLRESEELYRSLFENMLNGFAYCRMEYENGAPQDFRYLAVNIAFESLTGLKEVVGKRVTEVIPGIRESDPQLFELYGRVAESGIPERCEIYLEALQMWFSVSVYSPIRGDFVAVFDVVTERKRAEEELRRKHAELRFAYEQLAASEENLRKNQLNLANAMDIGQIVNWEFDVLTGTFTFNDQFYALYGTTADREGGYQMPAPDYVREFVHPDDVIHVTQVIGAVASVSDPNYSMQVEHRIIRRDGTVRHIVVRFGVLMDVSGHLVKTFGINQDITDRIGMEDALRNSEKKYRYLIDNITDVVWAATPDLRFSFISSSVEKLSGYSARECIGKSIFSFLTEASAEVVRERVRTRQKQMLSGSGSTSTVFEVEMVCKDGTSMWTEVSSTPVLGPDGTITGFQGITRNIAERRAAEKALQESEAKFRDIFDKANDGIFIHELRKNYAPGTLLEANETACRMLQYDRDAIVGHSPLEFGTTDFSKPTHIIDGELHSVGYSTFETQQRRKDGEIFPVEINAHVVTIQGKRVVLSIIRDITERKRSLEALRESDEKFRAISETAQDAIFIKDAHQRYTHVNPAMERLFGIPAADFLSKTTDVIFSANTAAQIRDDDEHVLAGDIVETDLSIKVKGDVRVLHTIRVPMRNTRGEIIGICGIARNITERKKAEEQVIASLREKEVLLKEIHHRVKNNMQVISSLLNLQARAITDPVTLNVFRESQARVKSMALVHEKMYQSNNLAEIEFGDYIKSLAPNLIHQFGKKNVTWTIDSDPIHLGVDTAIPCGLIVNELITNALKHAFPDGKQGVIAVEFRHENDQMVLLKIAD